MAMSIKSGADIASADYNLSKMLDQPGGFEKIAQQLPKFIRQQRDYTAFCRKVLFVHTVDSTEIQIIENEPFVYYQKDFNSRAAFYADDAQIPRYQIEGEGVNVGIITVASDDITINRKRLTFQKFNYLERVRELASQAVAKVEDIKLINLVETLLLGDGTNVAPTNAERILTSTATELTKDDLVDLQGKLVEQNVPAASFVMHPVRQNDILKWGFSKDGADVDPTTMREMIENGVRYKIFGLSIITSIIMEKNSIYCFSTQEYVGRMPIVQDVTVSLTERPNKLEKGLFLFEFLGMYLASHLAVAKLIINYNGTDPVIRFINNNKDEAFAKGESSLDGRTSGFNSLEETNF